MSWSSSSSSSFPKFPRPRISPNFNTSSCLSKRLLTTATLLSCASCQQIVPDFSLQPPLSWDHISNNFETGGIAAPAGDVNSMLLSVGVPGRVGLLSSKKEFQSDNFQADFSFSVSGPDGRQPHKEGFAFWYVKDFEGFQPAAVQNALKDPSYMKTNSVAAALDGLGRDLIGYKSKFSGLGVFFTSYQNGAGGGPAQPLFKEGAVAATNDGSRTLFTDMDFNSGLVKPARFRNQANRCSCRIRVQPGNVKVEVFDGVSWSLILDENKTLPKGGYFAFTGFIKDNSYGGIYDTVRIWDLRVTNFDSSYVVSQSAAQTKSANLNAKPSNHGDFLYEHGHHKEKVEESHAIHRLTNMVMKLISETEPMRAETERTLKTLITRVTSLEKIFVELKQEINSKTGHDLDAEFNAIKNEILNLSQTATAESETRKAKLNELKEAVTFGSGSGGLASLAEKNHAILESISAGWKWTFWLSLMAVAMIVAAGFALYHRFRVWDKKHIL